MGAVSKITRRAAPVALGVLALGAALVRPVGASPAVTELVSIRDNGTQGNDISGRFAGPAINGNGQVVAFDSQARTLVPHDTNRSVDVFVHDRVTDSTERVSVSSEGRQANGTSTRPVLDAAGDLVAFDSSASNLVPDDTNGLLDVFVHSRSTGATERVDVSSTGEQANGSGNSPSISAEGRFVTFVSSASNLVPNDANGTVEDIFVRDLVAHTTELVSVTSDGKPGHSSSTVASISADGRWVAFSSFADNFSPGDTNQAFDVFLHDRVTGRTGLVSRGFDGSPADATSSFPSVSRNGRFVAYWSNATNLVPDDTNGFTDIFVWDRATGTTVRASVSSDEQQSDGDSQPPGVRGFTASGPDITPDGRLVAFFSSATNLVPDDTNECPLFFDQFPGQCPDAFVRNLDTGTTTRVSLASDGSQANDRNADPVISDDGSTVAFFSASALVPSDSNTCPLFTAFPGNCPDIYVHQR
jgi:WD40-like Beta Propeller Repeat